MSLLVCICPAMRAGRSVKHTVTGLTPRKTIFPLLKLTFFAFCTKRTSTFFDCLPPAVQVISGFAVGAGVGGCANCGGWAAAATVTTAAVTTAAVASANAANANANAAAASANAYNSGYNAGATSSSTAVAPTYSVGQILAKLPAGCITPTVRGTTYYLCGNTWFSANYGAKGVYYRVLTAP